MGQIPPSNHTNNTDTSIAGIDMSVIRRLITILDMGTGFGASANAQLYYRASAQANMNVTTNVASAIPLTVNTNNRVATLEVRADQLPAGTRYVQPVLIINTAAANIGVVVIGDEAGYKPGNQYVVTNTVSSQAVT